MRLLVMVLLNGLLASTFAYWLRGEYHRAGPPLRRWLLPALGWRLLLTAISSQWPSPDLVGAAKWSRLLGAFFRERPGQVWATLQGASFQVSSQHIAFYQWSGTLFYYKVLALLSIASGGALWLNGLYLSLLAFVACWAVVRAVSQTFRLAPAAAGVAWLAWPSVVWWTAGFTKETLVVGAGAGLVALALPTLYGEDRPRFWPAVGRAALFLLLAWLMVRMRYFFALPLLGGLLALAAVRLATRRHWLGRSGLAQVGGLLLGLALASGGALALGGQHVALSYFSREVGANYRYGLRTSAGRPHLEYADWQPTPAGLVRHAPLAAAQVLVRPWPGESARLQYVGVGLENALLCTLLGLALVAAGRGRAGRLPVALVVVLGLYCLLLAAFIGLSTPNLGTLSRYRVALLPWLLLLVLQNDYARGLLKKLGL
ncbi:hypothetical protein [Hymenobacter cheonanensis]|uniref:hypothetical protein n=1 Tax=Hymenobacter sp. CA2-7 TaxID=3063993 RepID=UPI0027133503|nr:hypothetical protein [Hymenobacter sp. CA2-7]MDO7886712.1 hypothetical protein [Hymenobacter sp. CA2-7]